MSDLHSSATMHPVTSTAAWEGVRLPAKILKINMKDVFDKLKTRRGEDGMTKGKFTNVASDAGMRRSFKAGADHTQMKAFASIQYGKASKLFDELA